MRTKLSASAPRWALLFQQSIEAALHRFETPERPVQLPEYANSAALPSATDYRAAAAFKKDIDMVVVSDGTNWRRLDTGALV